MLRAGEINMGKEMLAKIPGKSENRAAAYFTIEASLIIPWMIIIFVLFIYLAFYQYDRVILSQDAYIGCLKESREKENYADGISFLAATDGFSLNRARYFMLEYLNENVGASGSSVTFSGGAGILPEVFTESEWIAERNWGFSFQTRSRKLDAPFGIRRYRRLKYVAEKAVSLLKTTADR